MKPQLPLPRKGLAEDSDTIVVSTTAPTTIQGAGKQWNHSKWVTKVNHSQTQDYKAENKEDTGGNYLREQK